MLAVVREFHAALGELLFRSDGTLGHRRNFLDYEVPTQQSFTKELREIIGDAAEVVAPSKAQ